MEKKSQFKKTNELRKELRRDRIDRIKNIISIVSRNNRKASYKKIIAEFCLSEGLSKRIVKEYLGLLVEAGQVIRNGDELFILQPNKEIEDDLKILDEKL